VLIDSDQIVLWQWGVLHLNATIAFTWVVMLLLTLTAWAVTRKLSTGDTMSHWQNLLETLVLFTNKQIADLTQQKPDPYLPFVATLFLLIATSNILGVVPGFHPPTASLSTTTALAVSVLLAVPIFGVAERGILGYLRHYLQPSPFMLPFNLIGEASRTLALAIRLYGNIMSGTMIAGILLSVVPFFFPVAMQLLGLLTGLIQAYIFAMLAVVYIGSATRVHSGASDPKPPSPTESTTN
jgi:F-type H+-transporting ATPase subunit a